MFHGIRSIAAASAALLLASCTSAPPAEEPVEETASAPAPETESEAQAPVVEGTAMSSPEIEGPTWFIDFAASVGNFDQNFVHGTGADGDTTGAYGSFQIETQQGSNWGFGVAAEAMQSDDDLLEDIGSPDSEGRQLDVFGYMLGIAHETDTFRLPIRVGAYVHQTSLEEQASALELDWNAIGLRFEAEPEEWIVVGDNFSWGLYAQGSVGVHRTFIESEAGNLSNDFNGRGMTLGGGFGVQALFGQHLKARLGYLVRRTEERDSHSDLGIFVNEMAQTFQGVVFELGLRF